MTTERDIGRLEAQNDELRRRVDALEEKLDRALAILEGARGGWRTVVMIGGAVAALFGFARAALDLLGHFTVPAK